MFSIRKFLQKNGTKKLPYNPGISPFSTTAVITDLYFCAFVFFFREPLMSYFLSYSSKYAM